MKGESRYAHPSSAPKFTCMTKRSLTSKGHPLPGLLTCTDTRKTLRVACSLPLGGNMSGVLRKRTPCEAGSYAATGQGTTRSEESSLEQSGLCYLEREAGPSDILVFAFWPPDL